MPAIVVACLPTFGLLLPSTTPHHTYERSNRTPGHSRTNDPSVTMPSRTRRTVLRSESEETLHKTGGNSTTIELGSTTSHESFSQHEDSHTAHVDPERAAAAIFASQEISVTSDGGKFSPSMTSLFPG